MSQDPNAPLVPIAELAVLLGLTMPLTPPLDSQMQLAVEAVSRLIRGYCGRMIDYDRYIEGFMPTSPPVNGVLGYRNGLASRRVTITEWPILKIEGISIDNRAVDESGYRINHATGIIQFLTPGVSPWGKIIVDYDGGFTPIPADLKLLVLDLVQRQLVAMGVDLSGGAGGGGSGAAAAVKAVTVGPLKVEYAVSSSTSATGDTGNSKSPLTVQSLAQFEDILGRYRHSRALAATGGDW